jgi:hypothetical protein
MSLWTSLAEFFFPALKFVFRCVICLLEQVIRADSAKQAVEKIEKAGWRGPAKVGEPAGWRCPLCAGTN